MAGADVDRFRRSNIFKNWARRNTPNKTAIAVTGTDPANLANVVRKMSGSWLM
jgi:hypothetical protein